MTLDAFERLQQLLVALEPEVKNMTGSSPGFVRDQLERVEKYGVNVRVSPKQMEWLENLYEKHVGSLDGLSAGDAPQATREEILDDEDDMDDVDDKIPF